MSDTAKRPPGFSTRNASLQHPVLVAGQVDDAVRDDDIDGVVGQRDGLDLALQELDILDARLLLVFAGERQHFVGHVEAVGLARGADAARRKQHVDAAAGAEVEHGLAGLQLGERRRVAAAERREHGRFGQRAFLGHVIEIGGDGVRSRQAPHRRRSTSALRSRAARPGCSVRARLLSHRSGSWFLLTTGDVFGV